MPAGSRNYLSRVKRALLTAFLLRSDQAHPAGGRTTHICVMVALVGLFLAGGLVMFVQPEFIAAPLLPDIGSVFWLGAAGLYLLERVVSVVSGWPLRRKALEHSFLMRHPVLLVLTLLLLLLVITLMEPTFLALPQIDIRWADLHLEVARPGLGGTGLQAAVTTLLLIAALPLMTILLWPVRFWRGVQEVRGDHPSLRERLRGWQRGLSDRWHHLRWNLWPAFQEGWPEFKAQFMAGLRNEDARDESLDFDEEPSRNDPCPCGSGNKYKRCHGDPTRQDG